MTGDQLMGLIKFMGNEVLNDPTLIEKKRIVSPSNASTSASESSSVVIHTKKKYKNSPIPSRRNHLANDDDDNDNDNGNDDDDDDDDDDFRALRIQTKNSKINTCEGSDNDDDDFRALRIQTKNSKINVGDGNDNDDDDDDDFNDYVIEPPLAPPKELHPDKLYGLFQFRGDDPSHCEIERDEAFVLLNDQDSYWWLVRREYDEKIGFAPAECLETYHERLARLNCWKNEEIERSSKENLNYPAEKARFDTQINKSVTFSNKVDIADYFYPDSSSESHQGESESESESELEPEAEGTDEDEVNDRLDFKYETSHQSKKGEVISDIKVYPLSLQKRNRISIGKNANQIHNTRSITTQITTSEYLESDIEESPFVAPNAFFQYNNYSGSIGSYSPSSSEMESPESTPPLNQFRRKPSNYNELKIKANIPQSKGTRDIVSSMKMLDELINDELNTPTLFENEKDFLTEKEEDLSHTSDISNGDILLSYDDNDDYKLSSSIKISGEPKNLSNLTESTFTNSNTSLQLTSTHTSVDEEELPKKESDESTAESLSTQRIHPKIDIIFKDTLLKINDLQKKLKLLQEILK